MVVYARQWRTGDEPLPGMAPNDDLSVGGYAVKSTGGCKQRVADHNYIITNNNTGAVLVVSEREFNKIYITIDIKYTKKLRSCSRYAL